MNLSLEMISFIYMSPQTSSKLAGAVNPRETRTKKSILRLTPLFLASRGLTAEKTRGAWDTTLREELVCITGAIFSRFSG